MSKVKSAEKLFHYYPGELSCPYCIDCGASWTAEPSDRGCLGPATWPAHRWVGKWAYPDTLHCERCGDTFEEGQLRGCPDATWPETIEERRRWPLLGSDECKGSVT